MVSWLCGVNDAFGYNAKHGHRNRDGANLAHRSPRAKPVLPLLAGGKHLIHHGKFTPEANDLLIENLDLPILLGDGLSQGKALLATLNGFSLERPGPVLQVQAMGRNGNKVLHGDDGVLPDQPPANVHTTRLLAEQEVLLFLLQMLLKVLP